MYVIGAHSGRTLAREVASFLHDVIELNVQVTVEVGFGPYQGAHSLWYGAARERMIRFAARTNWDLSHNALTSHLVEAKTAGKVLIDLTESNPTRCSIIDTTSLVALLGDGRGTQYAPQPLGDIEARKAIARYYLERGFDVNPANIVLTASTSEAYGWLFKLLADRGDNVLVPVPSYPLLDYIACLEDVTIKGYSLIYDEDWRMDCDGLQRSVDDRTRAIVLVNPNNPTGSFVHRDDASWLEAWAARQHLPLIVDEVFGDYAYNELLQDRRASFAGSCEGLTFVLSGLSKVLALPQLKLGWIVVLGPQKLVEAAISRIEVIADTYLSVSTPVQLSLPKMLEARSSIQKAIQTRLNDNLQLLDSAIATYAKGWIERLRVDGGWYAIVKVPRTNTDDEWVEFLIREKNVVVHPGYLFDMPGDGFLVLSLLLDPKLFQEAVLRLCLFISVHIQAVERST